MIGENFTQEFRFPIKIYRIKDLEFSNGIEVRKVIFSGVIIFIMVVMFLIFGIKSDTNFVKFILKNWLIILIVVPSLISFVVFNLKYDNKNIIPFIKDRISFLLTNKREYEHFIEVPINQMDNDLVFESFYRNVQKGDGI